MDNAALFLVRTEDAARVKVAMEAHQLAKDRVGSYKYNNAVTLVENIRGVLGDKYFESTTDSMQGLISAAPNKLMNFKANEAVTRADVKAESIAAAAAIISTAALEITTSKRSCVSRPLVS